MMMKPALRPSLFPKALPTPGTKPAAQPGSATQPNQAPHFGGPVNSGLSTYQKLLHKMDFRSFGTSYLNQIQVIYAGCIGWRLVAANERRKDSPTKSWNEVRENALRDSMGYLFWFFATPMLQRGILSYVTKKHNPAIGNSLYEVNKEVANGKGFIGRLKAWNPLYRVDIPSSEQVKNQKEQALQHLRSGTEAYQKTEAYFNKLSKYRNVATGLGLINTILLIGIGINLLNFYLTRKNMERRKAALEKPEFPPTPPLPKLPTAPEATTNSAPSAVSTAPAQPPALTSAAPQPIPANLPPNPWVMQTQPG